MKSQSSINCPHCGKEINLDVTTEYGPDILAKEVARQTEGLRREIERLRKN